MFEDFHSRIIYAEVISAYLHCPRKAFLLHCSQERGTPHEYQGVLEEHTKFNRVRYLDSLRQAHTSLRSYNDGGLSSRADIITEGHLRAAGVEAYCDVLTRVGMRHETPGPYEPTLVVGTYGVEKEQIFSLSIAGYALGQLQGRPPAAGHLVTVDGKRHRANLQPLYKTVNSMVERIKGWSNDSSAQLPPVVLNKHCPYCPFKESCSQQAERADC